jgi:hypothetical protein
MKNPLYWKLAILLLFIKLHFKCPDSRRFNLFVDLGCLPQVRAILDMFNFLIHVCAYRFDNDTNLWVLLSYSTLEVLSIGLILFFIVTGGCFMTLTVSAIINGK